MLRSITRCILGVKCGGTRCARDAVYHQQLKQPRERIPNAYGREYTTLVSASVVHSEYKNLPLDFRRVRRSEMFPYDR
jgi:hypothetical protein